jgi:probable rRNA maturation factor
MIKIFNSKKLLNKYSEFPIKKVKSALEDEIILDKDINIIFLDANDIKNLNKQYRNLDEVTDVLSFNIEEKDVLGEIYICPEYIINTTDQEYIEQQITRIIIHGILHLKGYDHKKKFRRVDYKDEPMYIKQEEILNKILKENN